MARRHRNYGLEFKRHVAEQYLTGEIPLARSARQHDISRNLIRVWIANYEAGDFDDEQVKGVLLAHYQARIAEIERKVGRLGMENDLLKKAAGHSLVASITPTASPITATSSRPATRAGASPTAPESGTAQ